MIILFTWAWMQSILNPFDHLKSKTTTVLNMDNNSLYYPVPASRNPVYPQRNQCSSHWNHLAQNVQLLFLIYKYLTRYDGSWFLFLFFWCNSGVGSWIRWDGDKVQWIRLRPLTYSHFVNAFISGSRQSFSPFRLSFPSRLLCHIALSAVAPHMQNCIGCDTQPCDSSGHGTAMNLKLGKTSLFDGSVARDSPG